MVISIADEDELFYTLPQTKLPKNWRTLEAYPTLQKFGSDWYTDNNFLVLKVP